MSENPCDWNQPGIAQKALQDQIIADATDPGSSVRVCHEQGETAVYVSREGKALCGHRRILGAQGDALYQGTGTAGQGILVRS